MSRPNQLHNSWWQRACARFYAILTRSDSVQPVDLILVLAGKMERKRYGLELFRAGVAPRLVLSIGRFEVSKMAQLDLEWIEDLKSLRDRTPPAERNFFVSISGVNKDGVNTDGVNTDDSGVHMEPENLVRNSTYGEALGSRRLIEHEGAQTVMVISTDIHLRRVSLTFSRVFRGTAIHFRYCPVPAPLAPMTRDNWWKRPADRRFVLTEMIKLAGYRAAFSAPEWAARRLMLLSGWGRK